ncbi:hypothetical protein [Amycolatopsis sp. lyj-109]|uniref:hypothetical protein n=1 Tax=Amycolatopsis sp. lyj-109 TaxID=2789287 RepID=UPI00397B2B85
MIVVNTSRYRSDALIITAQGVRAVPLPDLTETEAVFAARWAAARPGADLAASVAKSGQKRDIVGRKSSRSSALSGVDSKPATLIVERASRSSHCVQMIGLIGRIGSKLSRLFRGLVEKRIMAVYRSSSLY